MDTFWSKAAGFLSPVPPLPYHPLWSSNLQCLASSRDDFALHLIFSSPKEGLGLKLVPPKCIPVFPATCSSVSCCLAHIQAENDKFPFPSSGGEYESRKNRQNSKSFCSTSSSGGQASDTNPELVAIPSTKEEIVPDALFQGNGINGNVSSDTTDRAKETTKNRAKLEHSRNPRESSRRRRPSNSVVTDLLMVPGIGPKNLEKLRARGIGELAKLKQLYLEKFSLKGESNMVDYLRTEVGITRRDHASSITAFVREIVEGEQQDKQDINDVTASDGIRKERKDRLTFCVEGNISVGKTTFLRRVADETVELRDLVEIVPEPVDRWQDVGPEHFNVLNAFYSDPQRYAYTFQNYVFVTRMMQEQESRGGLKPLRLMERSVFTDRMVFVRAVHEARWMNEMEVSIYDSWFDPLVSSLPGLVPDGFIYLRAEPRTCHQRMQGRGRGEEKGVTLDYLRSLHEKHEQWLLPARRGMDSSGRLSLEQWSLGMEEEPPAIIADRVFGLEGDNVHSSIRQVPALVLDCDATIDFSLDLDAKKLYASQVAAFFTYVKKMKDARNSNSMEGNQQNVQDGGVQLGAGAIEGKQPLILPWQQSLYFPGQKLQLPPGGNMMHHFQP